VQRLDFEVPINRVGESDFPYELLDRARAFQLLRLDSDGYVFVCKISSQDWTDYKRSQHPGPKRKPAIKVLGKEKSDTVLLKVSGEWMDEEERNDPKRTRQFEFFRAMERAPLFGLGNPTIDGNALHFTAVADATQIKKLLNGLKMFNIPYKINNLSRLKVGSESLMSELTTQQDRMVRLAHTLGYYDIPRRRTTEELAAVLGMDKATVGEHLRRAEKNIFDKILAQTVS
jgi:hypothetical protein